MGILTVAACVMTVGMAGLEAAVPHPEGELAARIAGSDAFNYPEAPIRRLCGLDTPIPYNRNLERAAVPQVDDIAREARKLARGEY